MLENGKGSGNNAEIEGLVDPVSCARLELAQMQAKERADREARENLWFAIQWAIFALIGLGVSIPIWDALSSFLFSR